MKKKMVIIRFGTPKPLKKEVAIVTELTDGLKLPALAVPLAGVGVISLIYTETSADDIVKIYRGIAEATEDKLPVLAFELGQVGAFLEDLTKFDKATTQFEQMCADWEREQGNDAFERMRSEMEQIPVEPAQETRLVRCTLGLDELLDIVNQRGGVDRLTQPERSRLEELSKY